MRNIQNRMSDKIRKFSNSLEEISTFAKGSDTSECVKAYKLQIRLIHVRGKYDRSRLLRNQLRQDLGWMNGIVQPSTGLPRVF